MPSIQVGESQISYEDYGAGPVLVFAHGVGGNRVSWHRQVPRFSRTHRVIAFDHRGFGSSVDAEGLGRSAYVSDLLALLDHLGIDRAVLIGQSMGGGTCAAFTCQYPDRVEGLVIADSLAGFAAEEPLVSALAATREANRELSQAERVLGPTMRQADPVSTLLYLQIASFNSVNIRTVRGQQPQWSSADLRQTGVPVLFVVGEQDILFTCEQVAAVHGSVPGSELVVIPDAGHSAYFEQPDLFNAALERFLQALRQPQ